METFQLLSNGGVKFNKGKYKKDVSLFTVCAVSLCSGVFGLDHTI